MKFKKHAPQIYVLPRAFDDLKAVLYLTYITSEWTLFRLETMLYMCTVSKNVINESSWTCFTLMKRNHFVRMENDWTTPNHCHCTHFFRVQTTLVIRQIFTFSRVIWKWNISRQQRSLACFKSNPIWKIIIMPNNKGNLYILAMECCNRMLHMLQLFKFLSFFLFKQFSGIKTLLCSFKSILHFLRWWQIKQCFK